MKAKWFGLLGLTLGSTYLYANSRLPEGSDPLTDLPEQTGEIPPTTGILRGKVSDAQSVDAVIGATIQLQDGRGTVTNYDGNFQLESVTFPARIRVSYVGYKAKELTVKDASSAVDIRLDEEQEALKEVVVVGYGTQKRTQLTGSVVKITADDLHVEASTTIDAALSGAVAGLNVTASSGQPGAASNIRIRGGNSVNANNDPLYVIDGFIYYKDASASKT
jgi:hypothetical protein